MSNQGIQSFASTATGPAATAKTPSPQLPSSGPVQPKGAKAHCPLPDNKPQPMGNQSDETIGLHSTLNIPECCMCLRDYHDNSLCNFLQFGWLFGFHLPHFYSAQPRLHSISSAGCRLFLGHRVPSRSTMRSMFRKSSHH